MRTADSPVRPAMTGTYRVDSRTQYTIGPDVIGHMIIDLVTATTVAVDIETFGLGVDAYRIKCVTLAYSPIPGLYRVLVVDPRDPEQARALRDTLAELVRYQRQLVFHNAAFDVPKLYVAGLAGLDLCGQVTDTMVYARLAWPDVLTRKTLDAVAGRVGVTGSAGADGLTMAQLAKINGCTVSDTYRVLDLDRPTYVLRAVADAVATLRILPAVRTAARATLTEDHPFSLFGVTGRVADRLVEREQRILRMSLRRACIGLRVDLDVLDKYRLQHSARQLQVDQQLSDLGIHPGNAADLIRYLDGIGALPAGHPRTKTGRASTTAKHLEQLVHPVAQLYVASKQMRHIHDDYLVKVVDLAITDSDGWPRIHPEINILSATTGRMSIGNPPLHQFPDGARGVILADPGEQVTSTDWSQIEPVIAANIAGDYRALREYDAGTGDMYSTVAATAGVDRKTAKITLLAQLYGEGLQKLAVDLGISVDDARHIRTTIFNALPKTRGLVYKLRDIGEKHRKIFTLSGRIIPVPVGKYNGQESVATHKAVNYFVQGSAYDLLAETMIAVDDAGLADQVMLTMHDELVTTTAVADDVGQIMRTVPDRLAWLASKPSGDRTPVLRTDRADLGDRWGTA